MSQIVETVRRICTEAAQGLTDPQVIAPLAVWDGNGKSMGVQIKATEMRGSQKCEVVGNMVLSSADLHGEAAIRAKADLLVRCMKANYQVTIRAMPSERLEAARAG